MEYSNDLKENEAKKVKNGQRESLTLEQLEAWSANDYEHMAELVLDIANGVYSIKDFVNDVKSYE